MIFNIVIGGGKSKTKIPVEKLDDGKRGGVCSCSRGDPVQSSLSYVNKVKIFVSLQNKINIPLKRYDTWIIFLTQT